MKKRLLFLWSLGALILFIGCNNSAAPETGPRGTIRLILDSAQSRAISSADSTIASENSNKYEVLIYNETAVLSSVPDLSQGAVTLAVEEGTYTVMILAGYSNSSEGVLLGSGYRESVQVTADTITDVSITLTSISHEYTVPATAACTGSYSVSVTGNTNNPLLQVSSGGTVMENRPYLEIGDSATNIYLSCTATGSLWTGTVDLTAPAQAGISAVKLYGSNIKLVDPSYGLDGDLKNTGTVNWKWPHESLAPAALSEEVSRDVEFTTASSGIAIIVGWG